MVRYVFLNALPLNSLKIDRPVKLVVTPVNPQVLKQLVPEMKPRVSYIRHPATVKMLNKLFGLDLDVSSGLYSYQPGDVLYVVTLRRPIRGAEVGNVTVEDVLIYQVEVVE